MDVLSYFLARLLRGFGAYLPFSRAAALRRDWENTCSLSYRHRWILRPLRRQTRPGVRPPSPLARGPRPQRSPALSGPRSPPPGGAEDEVADSPLSDLATAALEGSLARRTGGGIPGVPLMLTGPSTVRLEAKNIRPRESSKFSDNLKKNGKS